jgi:hypothetical protein
MLHPHKKGINKKETIQRMGTIDLRAAFHSLNCCKNVQKTCLRNKHQIPSTKKANNFQSTKFEIPNQIVLVI